MNAGQRAIVSALDALKEFYKALVFEVWTVGARLTTMWMMVVLWFTGGSRLFAHQRDQIRPHQLAVESPRASITSTERVTAFETLCEPASEGDATLLAAAAMRLSPIGSSKRSAAKAPSPMAEETGFLEDVRLNLLLFIDAVFAKLTRSVDVLFHSSLLSIVFLVVTLPVALLMLLLRQSYRVLRFMWRARVDAIIGLVMDDSTVDYRPVRTVVAQAGYPFVRYQVVTDDGYIIRLDRLPNKSNRVVYLQHGVFDNSFCWVSTGAQSLAYRLHDLGYDVYLANLRGTTSSEGGQRHINENISSRDYWSFSMNEHALYDLPAFFRKIAAIKLAENGPEPYRTTIVSHSLGAAVTLMYLVYRRMELARKLPTAQTRHWIDAHRGVTSEGEGDDHSSGADTSLVARGQDFSGNQSVPYDMNSMEDEAEWVARMADSSICAAVCLSPAGVHHEATKLLYVLIPLIEMVLFLLPIHVFRFPSRNLASLVSKLWHDVKQTPTTKYMLGFFMSLLLGGEADDHSIHQVKAQNIFSGTSAATYRHFVQIWRKDRFQGFDYGPDRNKALYGSTRPPSMLDNYGLIDVDVHFVTGMNDNLIPSGNVLRHYEALRKVHPDKAFLDEFADAGHLEFTVGLRDDHISRIIGIINQHMKQ